MPRFSAFLLSFSLLALPAQAESLKLSATALTEWKAVYGRIEAHDRSPARARLGGTMVELTVVEGDLVQAGQPLARIVDEKLAFQLSALQAQRGAAVAQLANAEADLARGEELLRQGVTTAQRLDALRTQVDVLRGQIAALDAQAEVITAQQREGTVVAPVAGRVLQVPLAQGAVVMPGEPVALIAGGGFFLRLAVPERHARGLRQGDTIRIGEDDAETTGVLARIYPLIENGRVIADVTVADLPEDFVDARVLVRLPVGTRSALLVPQTALITRSGLDFVAVAEGAGIALRTVVPGDRHQMAGTDWVEILSGLRPGDLIETAAPRDEQANGHD